MAVIISSGSGGVKPSRADVVFSRNKSPALAVVLFN